MTTTIPTPLRTGANAPSTALCSNAPIPPRPMEAGLLAWQPGRLHRQQNCFVTESYWRHVDGSDREGLLVPRHPPERWRGYLWRPPFHRVCFQLATTLHSKWCPVRPLTCCPACGGIALPARQGCHQSGVRSAVDTRRERGLADRARWGERFCAPTVASACLFRQLCEATRSWHHSCSQPNYGKIKAARCGAVGRLESVGIAVPANEVHFSSQPGFSDNARKINARSTSCEATWGTSAVTAAPRVVPRTFRPFGSAPGAWHIAAVTYPHKFGRLVDGPGRET